MPVYRFLIRSRKCMEKDIVFKSEGGKTRFKLDNIEQAKGFAKAMGIYEHYVPMVDRKKKYNLVFGGTIKK